MIARKSAALAALVALPSVAYADGGLLTIVNWYKAAAKALTGTKEGADYWWPVLAALMVLGLIFVMGQVLGLHKRDPEKMTNEEILPPGNFGLLGLFELMWAVISSTLESVIGKKWENYAPLLGGTFLFIIISNLSGLVPGFAPATEQMNTTLGIALVIFLAFNYVGFKYGKMEYLKHMCGPLLALAPVIFVIELISMLARPVSLSLRLFGNISGDHLVFNVFSTLMNAAGVPFLPIPAAILVFGTLIACLQAFIFMTLSAVYVRLSLDTAHH